MAQNYFGGLEQSVAMPSFTARIESGVQKPRPDHAMFTQTVAKGPSGWRPPMTPTRPRPLDPVRRVQPIKPNLPIYGHGGIVVAGLPIEPRMIANGTGVYIPLVQKPVIKLNDGPVVPVSQSAHNVNVRGAPQHRAKPRGTSNVRGGGSNKAGPRNERPKNVTLGYVKKKDMEGSIDIGSNKFLPSDWNYNI